MRAERGFRTSCNLIAIANLRLSRLKHLPAHPQRSLRRRRVPTWWWRAQLGAGGQQPGRQSPLPTGAVAVHTFRPPRRIAFGRPARRQQGGQQHENTSLLFPLSTVHAMPSGKRGLGCSRLHFRFCRKDRKKCVVCKRHMLNRIGVELHLRFRWRLCTRRRDNQPFQERSPKQNQPRIGAKTL